MNFYAVIIGTEILNGRREDKHFSFLRDALGMYGHTLYASFVIKDDVELIKQVFNLIKADQHAVLFSFGGIGSTPDDLTRQIAAEVFRDASLVTHPQFLNDIIERFGEEAYPHRIHMADLPKGATLLQNPVNNMSGFALDNRYFFVPGFPSMAHPMIRSVLKKFFSASQKIYRKTLFAHTSENTLIDLMQQLPTTIELSSLPVFQDNKPHVELSLACSNEKEVNQYFHYFTEFLDKHAINYEIREN